MDISLDRRGGTVWLTLNRPAALNTLSRSLVAELAAAIRNLREDASVRSLVITGAGDKAFCAGADLKERRGMSLDETRTFIAELNGLLNEIGAFPAPVIAALNGVAFGGGFELALACDMRLAADTAQMGLPEVRLGIIPGAGGTQRLTRVAGLPVAKELILTGRRIPASRALELRIVSEVVPAGDLMAAVDRLAAEIAEGAPLAVSEAKHAVDGGRALRMGDALALEQACYEVVLTSADRDEGLTAFMEKRRPVFKGK